MNSLTIKQKTSETERYVPNEVITTLYAIGKDDDENQTLTSGVDTTDENRPVTSVEGSIAVRATYDDYIQYLTVKFPNLNISADSTYIHFEDPEVERVLLANGVGDGVGITIQNARDTTRLRSYGFTEWGDGWFRNNSTATSFLELGQFGVRQIGYFDFAGSSFKKIDLSKITTIYRQAFYQASLEELNAPSLEILQGSGNFFNSGLKKIISLGSLGRIENTDWDGVFAQCSQLTEVNLPSTLTHIQDYTFRGCSNLVTLNYDFSRLEYLGIGNFRDCTSLELELANMTSLLNVESEAFPPTTKYVYIPKITHGSYKAQFRSFQNFGGAFCSSPGNFWFRVTSKIIYFKALQDIYPGDFAFNAAEKIVFNNTTPPTLHNSLRNVNGVLTEYTDTEIEQMGDDGLQYSKQRCLSFTGGSDRIPATIYVPDSAVAAYQNAYGWADVANHIHSISELNQVATKADWDILSVVDKSNTLIQEYMN